MLESRPSFRLISYWKTLKIAWIKNNVYDVSAVTHLYGLGYSFVEIHEKTIGMDARLWVLATPVDGTLVELVLVSQVREVRNPKRPIVGLRFLPTKLRHRLLNHVMLWSLSFLTQECSVSLSNSR